MKVLLFLILVGLASASAQLQFVEEVGAVKHSYMGGADYIVGGGLATFDCDNNELPDLFIAGGEEPAALFRNISDMGGALTFQKEDLEGLAFVTGAYPLKLDADEHTDLIVLRLGENLMLRGLGDCQFERANEAFGFDGGDAWTTSFSAAWFEDDALPTLAFGNYIDRSLPGAPFGTCFDNALLRPMGESYQAPQTFTGYCALSLLFSDWNRSGRADLRVSNDRQYYLTNEKRDGSEQLFKLSEDDLIPYTQADGWEKLQIWGMGIASADLTQDGYPELYLTSMADQKLRSLIGDASAPSYRDRAYQLGITGHQSTAEAKPSTGWHAEFDDLNHDGLLDLFVTKGNVDAMPAFALEDPNNLFIQQKDGAFLDIASEAGVLSGERGRGASLTDLNRDGLLDIIVVNRNDPVQTWRNTSALGNWLSVSVSQPGTNPDAVGAWLELRTLTHSQVLERSSGGGHASGSLTDMHFGLGENAEAELRIIWPGGDTSDWYTLPANSFVKIQKGEEPVIVAQ